MWHVGLMLSLGLMACGKVGTPELAAAAAAPVSSAAANPNQQRILGFEQLADWAVNNGSATLSSSRIEGQSAFSVVSTGNATLKSSRLSSLGTVTRSVFLLVQLPEGQAWRGNLQLRYDLPSRGKRNVLLGSVTMANLPRGKFQRVELTISEQNAAALATTYDDLQLTVTLRGPAENQPILLDTIHFQTPAGLSFEHCVNLCGSLAGTGCSAIPASRDCVQGCRLGVLHPGCQSTWQALMACSEQHRTTPNAFQCDTLSGDPYLPACTSALSAYRSCVGPNPL